MPDPVRMLVIYDHPRDIPDKVVVREWIVAGGRATASLLAIGYDTLDLARAACDAEGFTRTLARDPKDDPVIVEVRV